MFYAAPPDLRGVSGIGLVDYAPFFANPHLRRFQDDPLINTAYRWAFAGHDGQFRESGEPFIVHPVEVAGVLAQWGLGPEEVAAGIMHDLLEDGRLGMSRSIKPTKPDLIIIANPRIADLVDGVSELGKVGSRRLGEKISYPDNLRKQIKYGIKDIAVLVDKLADRLHNMRTLEYMPEWVQTAKALETMFVYVPIADALGMWDVKRELEDLAFKYLQLERYKAVKAKREKLKEDSRSAIERFASDLGAFPTKMKIEYEARGIYELHQRMQRRQIELEGLSPSDIWRAHCTTIEGTDSYQILRDVHGKFKPVPTEIRDYIASPLPNGHRFLQTYVVVPGIGRVLVHISNEDMREYAKLGVVTQLRLGKPTKQIGTRWLGALYGYLTGESDIGTEEIHAIFDDARARISVVSFDGNRQVELPVGSSVADFARAVHLKIYLEAEHAFVNGTAVPLDHTLNDGDSVQIVRGKDCFPSLTGSRYLRTERALKSLRAVLRNRDERIRRYSALNLLDDELMGHLLSVDDALESPLFISALQEKGKYGNVELFLGDLGLGRIRFRRVKAVIDSFIESFDRDVESQRAQRLVVRYPVAVIASDRIGLFDDVIAPIKKASINLNAGVFGDYTRGPGGKKAIIALMADVVQGEAGRLQQCQVKNSVELVAGVEKVVFPSDKEAFRIMLRSILEARGIRGIRQLIKWWFA